MWQSKELRQDLHYACEMPYSLSLLPNLCLRGYDSSHPIARKGHVTILPQVAAYMLSWD